jgi:hypothetical protein
VILVKGCHSLEVDGAVKGKTDGTVSSLSLARSPEIKSIELQPNLIQGMFVITTWGICQNIIFK